MKCLCCGKPITNSATNVEKEWCWHKKCVKRFFQTDELPILDITKEQLEILATETVNEGLTVPGVQKKLSLHLSTDLNARLTIVDYPTGYILKPQTEEFDNMPEFEDLAMRLAEIMGIQTVPHALIKMNDEYAYITKRIDREISEKETKLYAMEDFCQLSYRLTQDKYKGSYEQCGRIIKKCSATPGLDLSELFLRVVGSFVMGNSDMHLKNFSLKETEPGSRNFQLSKAYDMLPVNVIMPEDKEQLALTINGKKRNIHKKEFRILAESCGIPLNSAERKMLSERMAEIADSGTAELILTTGGTGFSPRDITPEATEDIIDRRVPGIPEAMRAYSMTITKRAMLSRSTAGIRKKTLIINLPGSPKAVKESLEYIIDALGHGIEIMTGEAGNCAR